MLNLYENYNESTFTILLHATDRKLYLKQLTGERNIENIECEVKSRIKFKVEFAEKAELQ